MIELNICNNPEAKFQMYSPEVKVGKDVQMY